MGRREVIFGYTRQSEKGKGYTKDGERPGQGPGNVEQERAPWKRTCKMVYEESQGGRGGGRVAAPNLAQLQLPFSSSVLRMCARGARCWAFSFSPSPSCSIPFSLSLSLSLSLSVSFSLSLLVSPFRPGLTRACSPARRRCRGARQHSLTRNCCSAARVLSRGYRATETLAFRFSSHSFFIDL